jgi:hypothetical protein
MQNMPLHRVISSCVITFTCVVAKQAGHVFVVVVIFVVVVVVVVVVVKNVMVWI